MTKPQRLLQQAREIAQSVESWADLSNALFNATDGLLTTAYRSPAERRVFTKSKEYAAIVSLIDQSKERFGLVEGATPKQKSGRFVVRLPQTLHAALEREAASEGVSLNQLAVSKLSIPLSHTLQRLHGK